MATLTHSEAVVINRPPETVYELVADVTRMGEYSPVCRACWWDDENHGVGAWFTGRNETSAGIWETRSRVVAAQPGRKFAFQVGGNLVYWGYTFEPVDGGTKVTESWELLPAGIEHFHQRFGDSAQTEMDLRAEAARTGIPTTLAALKNAAESA